ncbi:hypothetical protein [Streptomyces sioyaensis]|uniref:hypothetical protein n=1 Tax=Streptomyces sioyaensis TaxID=67364 RepID=UPI003D72ACE5
MPEALREADLNQSHGSAMSGEEVQPSAPPRRLRETRKWVPAGAAAVTEAAQYFTEPQSPLDRVFEHAHTAAMGALGLQLVVMMGYGLIETMKLRGSFTVTWGDQQEDESKP